jgi:hypothetical protein
MKGRLLEKVNASCRDVGISKQYERIKGMWLIAMKTRDY